MRTPAHIAGAPARPWTPASPAGAPDRARQERFLRQLGPAPWEAAVDETEAFDANAWLAAGVVDPVGGDDSGSQGEGGHDPQDGDAPDEPTPPAEAPPPAAPEPVLWPTWAWLAPPPTAGGAGRDGGEGGDGAGHGEAAAVRPVSPRDDAPPWLHDMVDQVAQLFTEGDPRFRHWSVRVPLDPTVLPDCTLQLDLSPDAMTLRFHAGVASSTALVCQHRDALRARLEALPSSPPSIAIDLE
jgi:hypothetical protein